MLRSDGAQRKESLVTNARSVRDVTRAGSLQVGDLAVPRLGFGTMQLPGPGSLGPPRDKPAALAVLRRAVELGVRFIDTSGYYGPDVANELICEALHPYPDDLLIASKAGVRRADSGFVPADTSAEIRAQVEHDLQVLHLDTLHLVHARRMPNSQTPYAETVGALAELRDRGLLRSIGVSNVTVEELRTAQEVASIASIENEYNVADRGSEELVEVAAQEKLAFVPFHPLALGALTAGAGKLGEIARERAATPVQVALAWLLQRSAAILPIPGTSSTAHLEENLGAAALALTTDQVDRLDALARSAT